MRLGYALKRIKEGHAIRDSIPFLLNRERNPKFGTMWFIGHSAAAVVNIEKICFTKNPLSINYPQWIAFARCSYKQLKRALMGKLELRGVEPFLKNGM